MKVFAELTFRLFCAPNSLIRTVFIGSNMNDKIHVKTKPHSILQLNLKSRIATNLNQYVRLTEFNLNFMHKRCFCVG